MFLSEATFYADKVADEFSVKVFRSYGTNLNERKFEHQAVQKFERQNRGQRFGQFGRKCEYEDRSHFCAASLTGAVSTPSHLNSTLQKLWGDWLQTFSATNSRVVWVDKRYLLIIG